MASNYIYLWQKKTFLFSTLIWQALLGAGIGQSANQSQASDPAANQNQASEDDLGAKVARMKEMGIIDEGRAPYFLK